MYKINRGPARELEFTKKRRTLPSPSLVLIDHNSLMDKELESLTWSVSPPPKNSKILRHHDGAAAIEQSPAKIAGVITRSAQSA
jgi:hypothetical protein